ncbi:MAG: DUF4864 domain-containing protein [Betaproteobacteria bacterium]
MNFLRQLLRALVFTSLLASNAQAAPLPGATTLAPAEWKAIEQTIDQQRAALKSGDGAKALAFATAAIRNQFGTPDNFLRMVRGSYGAILTARATNYLEGAVIEGAVIQPLRLILPDNTVLVALYQMEMQKDGRWKIAGCVLAPSTVQAT